MTLANVLDVISGGTKVEIHANMKQIFSGRMCDISKEEWYRTVGPHLQEEVYRINTIDGYITIAV